MSARSKGPWSVGWWLVLALFLASCTHPSRTEIVVVVDGDLTELHEIDFAVRRDQARVGETPIGTATVAITDRQTMLPVRLPVIAADDDDTRPARITVTANAGTADAYEVTVTVPFVAHRVTEVTVFLAESCRDPAARARCTGDTVCGRQGACVSIPVDVLDPSTGNRIDAGTATTVTTGMDGSAPVDANASDVADAVVRDTTDVVTVDAADVVASDATDVVSTDAIDAADVISSDATDAADAHDAADASDAADAADVVDPCATANGGCDPLTTCTYTAGARTCSACPTDYTGTGATRCVWNDPSLVALVPSAGSLTPAFASATTHYEITVGLSTASLGLRLTVSMPAASTITVDGATVPSGGSSVARALALGDTSFNIVVTAASGVSRRYTVTVHRALHLLQQAYVKASNTDTNDDFGFNVALAGDTLAVGAYRESSRASGVDGNQADNSAGSSGAVYVFTRTGATWTQQAYLKASNTGTSDSFGRSVALSGNTLVVGATGESSSATGIGGDQTDNRAMYSGAVYVFTRTGTTWTQQAYLKASNAGANDNFGSSVAIAGETLAVSALGESSSATGIDGSQTDNSAAYSGAVYVFTRTGTTWTQQAYLKASNARTYADFGTSLALSGDTLAVGAYGENSHATGIDGDQTDSSTGYAGAVYVFTRSGQTWAQQAYVKASNTGGGAQFGWSVALAGDTLAVGAFGESSAATGIDGDQTDSSASGSGAVYVFTRAGTTWRQQAYVKASNTGEGDQFGSGVALSGDILAVGAPREASGATGIDGDANDDGTTASGAVYVFTRTGTTWTQRSYVKASNTGANDQFGTSIALSDTVLAVGATGEASVATGIDGNQADNGAAGSGAAYVFALGL